MFGDDHLSRLIYQEFLLMACNTEQVKNVNGQIFKLERGQCYYTTEYLSQMLNRNRKTIANAITRLNKVYNRTDNRTTPKGSIITLLNYDEVIKLDNKTDNKTDNRVTTDGQQTDTNKNDKSVKPVKSVKTVYGESVFLTKEEFEKLSVEFGEVATTEMIKMLDNYKLSKGKTYKSDYRAILSWVVDKYKLKHPEKLEDEVFTKIIKRSDFDNQETFEANIEYYKENFPNFKLQIL